MPQRVIFPGWLTTPPFESDPFDRRSAWLWLLQLADENTGEVQSSSRQLAMIWQWNHSKVQRFLADLIRSDYIITASVPGGTVITICNYDKLLAHPWATVPDLKQPAKKRKKSPTRAHQLPDDWLPTQDFEIWAESTFPEIAFDETIEHFIDYYRANGKAFKDWHAACRNWFRNARTFNAKSSGSKQGGSVVVEHGHPDANVRRTAISMAVADHESRKPK